MPDSLKVNASLQKDILQEKCYQRNKRAVLGAVHFCKKMKMSARHLERRLPVSGLECCPACHPERSEGPLRPSSQVLRFAQDDRPSLQMSRCQLYLLTYI